MPLGASSVEVPRLGVGVMTWGPAPRSLINPAKQAYGGPASAEDEARAFEAALKVGTVLFDTAEMYSAGASETRLGELAAGHPALVATKFPPSPFASPLSLPREFERSLARLGRSSVDLLQHHFPTSEAGIRRIMPLLAQQVHAGKARAVGVSNYSASQMRLAHELLKAEGVPLASNQVEYSLLHRQPERELLGVCRELKITLIAYMPLAMGALTGKYTSTNRPVGLRRFLPYFQKKNGAELDRLVATLTAIGQNHGKTASQIALRWLLDDPLVLPIPGAKNAEQVVANAGALGFRLNPQEREELNQLTLRWV